MQRDAQRGDEGAPGGSSRFRPRRWSELSGGGGERMETILEQQRRYHEEKERLMDVMAKEMLTKKSTVSGPGQGLPVRLGPMLGVPSLGGLSGTLRLAPLPPPGSSPSEVPPG